MMARITLELTPMNKDPVLFLSAADVRRALPMREAVEVMKSAFAALSAGEALVPLRSHLEVPEHEGVLLLMPCYLPSANALSLKAITVFGGNPALGLPRIQALVTLYDATTGHPLAILDGAALTAQRTGAASGAATDLLARADSTRVAILGAGVQARTQLEGVCAVRPIHSAWVFDVLPKVADQFAHEMSAALGIEVLVATSAREAIRDADIICAASSSRTPVFADADLKPGVHINAVGSYQPAVREIPAETVVRARVVVDHRESALAETGDLLIPIQQGVYCAEQIAAELGEVVNDSKPGRANATETTLFKSVGIAIQDLAAAVRALENARALGIGTGIAL
jgi:ornithine cyclodeaminase/alanine dehydrogenase-like protein (mu-crystallin family)